MADRVIIKIELTNNFFVVDKHEWRRIKKHCKETNLKITDIYFSLGRIESGIMELELYDFLSNCQVIKGKFSRETMKILKRLENRDLLYELRKSMHPKEKPKTAEEYYDDFDLDMIKKI